MIVNNLMRDGLMFLRLPRLGWGVGLDLRPRYWLKRFRHQVFIGPIYFERLN